MNGLLLEPNHTYSVEFRLAGEELNPGEVSSLIGLKATGWSDGEQLGSRRRHPFWGYNGSDDPQFQDEWQSLEDGLTLVSRKLSPFRSTITQLLNRFSGIWWCGHFQSSYNGGPMLSPQLLAEIASFGCPLLLDTYHSEDISSLRPVHSAV